MARDRAPGDGDRAAARAEAAPGTGRDQIDRRTGARRQLVSASGASEAESATRLTTISRLDRDSRKLTELLDRSEATSAERLRPKLPPELARAILAEQFVSSRRTAAEQQTASIMRAPTACLD